MTSEEAIAAIAKEMKEQAALEEHMRSTKSTGHDILFSRAKSYWRMSDVVAQTTGEKTGVTQFKR
jgi:hypothetical protein